VKEPIWIRQDVVLAMHEEVLMLFGGPEGVRDMGLLESALVRPKNLFAYSEQTPSLAQMAASYAKGIVANHAVANHAFVDGNKRTAFMISVTFLKLNGLQLSAPKEESVLKFWALAAREISEEHLADWFAHNTHS
jgi:death-on-curing protein